jgi:hypothetical protein
VHVQAIYILNSLWQNGTVVGLRIIDGGQANKRFEIKACVFDAMSGMLIQMKGQVYMSNPCFRQTGPIVQQYEGQEGQLYLGSGNCLPSAKEQAAKTSPRGSSHPDTFGCTGSCHYDETSQDTSVCSSAPVPPRPTNPPRRTAVASADAVTA